MADDTARAVGAGLNEPITIGGKVCKIRPLTIRELGEVERDCLRIYRKSFLETWSSSLELFPESDRESILRSKVEEASRWDVTDLPSKPGHDPGKILMTEKLRAYLQDDLSLVDSKDNELRAQTMASVAMDQGMLTSNKYQELTGHLPVSHLINYSQWWISSTFDGRLSMITACLSPCGVTQDEIIEEMRNNPSMGIKLASDIEAVSTPEVGNG